VENEDRDGGGVNGAEVVPDGREKLGSDARILGPWDEDLCWAFLAKFLRKAWASTGGANDENESSPAEPSSELMWNTAPSLGARRWFRTGVERPPAAPSTAGGTNAGSDPPRM
jgi:hypothetical protein